MEGTRGQRYVWAGCLDAGCGGLWARLGWSWGADGVGLVAKKLGWEERGMRIGNGRSFEELEEHLLTSGRNDQEVHLATVVEILQSIKQSEMSPMLSRIYGSEGGTETLDVLMKYL